jgi:prepilin-type N-terminal cleavage/methylation domain-containing protein
VVISSRKMRGFSLLEMAVALAILLIASAVALMAIQPTLKATRVTSAYNTTLNVMRQARDYAIGQRQIYYVTFTSNAAPVQDTITITQGISGQVIDTVTLPSDVKFTTLPVFPNPGADGFGTGGTAIDFDQGIAGGAKNVVYFQPDGTAADVLGNINNGVVYMARQNDPTNARALTLWGGTGRLRGWHLYPNGAAYYWRQQ